ncbi:MAG: hypothetical protein WC205_10715 [Opitutaceae bacterium]
MSSQPPSPPEALIEGVREHIGQADAVWRSGDVSRLPEGLKACDEALAKVHSTVVKTGPDEPAVLPAAMAGLTRQVWLQRGHLLDAMASVKGDPKILVEALKSYDQAIELGRQMPAEIGVLAVTWMSRGKALERLGSPEALTESVRCYDEAITLLGGLPPDASVELRNMLGAAWMSRAGGQQRRGELTGPNGAAQAFEEAIACLEACGPEHPMVRRNLASAWTNLGLLRQGAGDAVGSVGAQEKALAAVSPLYAAEPGALGQERATILLNLGQAQCAAHQTQAGLANLREAITGALARAENDPGSADTVLRARHALAVTLGAQLAAGSPGDPARAALLEEAGDAVEDGLALLNGWGERAAWFSAIGTRLFEFGAWFYRTQQLRFLGEFLLEHLGEDAERARIAAGAVAAAREMLTQRNFNDTSHGDMGRVLDILQDLGAVEARLKARNATA